MLLENTLMDDRIRQCIAGIGININQAEFKSNAPNPVSLVQITGVSYTLDSILDETLNNISHYYDKIKAGKNNEIIRHYKESLFRKDGYHLYNDDKSCFLARIKDVEPSGILVLETIDNQERHFAFKEVKYIL
jgi:BirA family biotin operon repressor/biotin-[acetyl-CoA-carboxylase] ligase